MLEAESTLELVLDGDIEDIEQTNLLIHIGQSHSLLTPRPGVIRLDAMDRLDLGRGASHGLRWLGEQVGRYQVNDPWMSELHASLYRRRGPGGPSFLLEDRHSTNGCRINGRPVISTPLAHGDIIETGRSFWKFHRAPTHRLKLLLERSFDGGPVLPTSSVSMEFLGQITRLLEFAATDIPLVILGESGTGKEVTTAEIHRLSGRTGRFVALNCAALPAGLIESEMFGHRRGAFTGATVDKRGIVEVAEGGTLLLDEVGDMPLAAQAKLLRLLQDGTFMRVGETMGRRVNVRYIAATHRDLDQMVKEGTFRGDLFARLNGFSVRLPALRHRKEDIGLLLSVFLDRRRSADGPAPTLEPRAYRLLLQYDWPYNIRELERTVQTALALAGPRGEMGLGCLPDALRAFMAPGTAPHLEESVAAPVATGGEAVPWSRESTPLQRAVPGAAQTRARLTSQELGHELPRLLSRHRGNLAEVARALSTSRSQIHRWLKRLNIDPQAYRK